MRMPRHGICCGALLLLAGCQGSKPRIDAIPESDQIEPLWSMNVACSGGLRIEDQKAILFPRSSGEYERWTLDIATGRVLEFPHGSVKSEGTPEDSHLEAEDGTSKPLNRPKVASVTPLGFEPLVLTNRFLFAKRSVLGFSHLHIFHDGEAIVIDRAANKIVWRQRGINTAIRISNGYVFICDRQKTAVFTLSAGRPKELTNFYAAVRKADLNKVRELYPSWRKIRLFDLGGSGPVSVAAKEGLPNVVELLLSLGELPNSSDADGFAPLLMALHWNNPDIAQLLLAAGADPNYKSYLWALPLNEAVAEGKRQIIEYLLQKGAGINNKSEWTGGTALHEAVKYRNYEAIETLIAAGADVHISDGDGLTPSQMAPGDECVTYLFTGGKIADKPETCRPPKRESIKLQF